VVKIRWSFSKFFIPKLVKSIFPAIITLSWKVKSKALSIKYSGSRCLKIRIKKDNSTRENFISSIGFPPFPEDELDEEVEAELSGPCWGGAAAPTCS